MSNLHQIYLANRGYATENNGFYVVAAEDILGSNLHRWHGTRTNVNESFDPAKGPLSSFVAGGKVKRCPAFRKYYDRAGQTASNFEAGCGGYGYNDQYIGGRSDLCGFDSSGSEISARDSEIKSPALTVMFTDTAFRQVLSDGQTVFIEYSFAHPPFWPWYLASPGSYPSTITGRPSPSIHFRHGCFTNVCWSDGHIGKETMDLSAPYVTHAIMTEEQTANMALGWFGPDNNNFFDLK